MDYNGVGFHLGAGAMCFTISGFCVKFFPANRCEHNGQPTDESFPLEVPAGTFFYWKSTIGKQ